MNYYKGCAIGLMLSLSLITADKAETRDRYLNQGFQELVMLEACAEELPDNSEQKKLRKKLRKRINTMKIWQLTQELDLSDDDWRKFFNVLKDFEKKEKKLANKRVEVKRQLRKAIEEDKNNEVSDLLKNLEALSRKGMEIQQKELEEMKGILSIKQLAQYALFREDFGRQIDRFITKCKKKKLDRDSHATPPE